MAKIESRLPATRHYGISQKGNVEKDDIWRLGSFGKYRYEAVLSDKTTSYGIFGGSVIRLKIFRVEAPGFRKGREAEVVNYNCGWKTKPKTNTERKVLQATLECLKNNII